jgi:hypothetical protein
MKSEVVVKFELEAVRAAYQRARNADDCELGLMLYGAQQALLWAIGKGMSVTDVCAAIAMAAKELADKGVSHDG